MLYTYYVYTYIIIYIIRAEVELSTLRLGDILRQYVVSQKTLKKININK